MTIGILIYNQVAMLRTQFYCCKRNSQPRQDNDLMNYKQKSTSSNQGYEYQEKTRLILIIGRKNKT
jgi:hypothetical protein